MFEKKEVEELINFLQNLELPCQIQDNEHVEAKNLCDICRCPLFFRMRYKVDGMGILAEQDIKICIFLKKIISQPKGLDKKAKI